MQATRRIYLDDDRCIEVDATVARVRDNLLAFDRTVFYPGGGGQPHDIGTVTLPEGVVLEIGSVHADLEGVVWHKVSGQVPETSVGCPATLRLDMARRTALSRYHTVLHVLNTIALRDHGGWITGAQIAVDYARIDFKLEGFSPAMCADIERKVNAVLDTNRPLQAYYLPESDFASRGDLLRTLEVRPPVVDGRVRVVAIEGFDAQACGGTHVGNTGEVGRFSVFRSENKGRINKRLYVRLDAKPAA